MSGIYRLRNLLTFLVLLTLAAALVAISTQAAPEIKRGLWDNYDPDTPGFPGTAIISAITADDQGRPWIATTTAGVARFNGETWKRFATGQGLPSNNVRDIYAHGSALWIATSQGIGYYDGQTWSAVPGPTTNTKAIAHRGGGFSTYLIATQIGLAECELLFPLSFSCLIYNTANSDLPDNEVHDVAAYNGFVWAVTDGGVARISSSGNWTVFTNANTPGCPVINRAASIAIDGENGRVWLGTSAKGGIDDPIPGQGACMVETSTGEWHHFKDPNSGLQSNTVTGVAVDADGRAWFSTNTFDGARGGAYVCTWINDQCYWANYTRSNSDLPQDWLTAVGVVGERVWFGSWDSKDLENYAANFALYWQELQGGEIWALDYLPDQIWAATENGIRRFNGFTWSTPLPDVSGRSLLALAEDDIWAGSADAGAWHFDGLDWDNFNTGNSDLPDDHVRAIARDELGRIWLGTWDGGAAVYDPQFDNWTLFDTNNVLPSNRVRSAFSDSTGSVWLGTSSGLARYDNDWQIFTTADGLPDNTVHAIAEDDDGRIWIGTAAGAAYWDGSSWTSVLDPLPNLTVRAIHSGVDGLIWLGTARGAVSFDGQTYRSYRARNSGLVNERLRAITSDEEGGLYFGGLDYVSGVDVAGGVYYRRPLGEPLGNLSPAISSFNPPQAAVGEWVTINGQNFTPNTKVYFKTDIFNEASQEKIEWVGVYSNWLDENTMQAKVSSIATKGPIRVLNDGGSAISATDFNPIPLITSVHTYVEDPQDERERAFPGTPVMIEGSNLNGPGFEEVRFGSSDWNSLTLVEQDFRKLIVIVPGDATTGKVRVRTASGTAVSPDNFSITQGGIRLFDWQIHQGLPGYPGVTGKSTVVRLFLGSTTKDACAYATRAVVHDLDPLGRHGIYINSLTEEDVPRFFTFCNTEIDYSGKGSIDVVIPGSEIITGGHHFGVTINSLWTNLISRDLGLVGFRQTGVARIHGAVPELSGATTNELNILERQMANMARALPVRDGVGDLGSGNGIEYVLTEYDVCDGTKQGKCGAGYEWDFWQQNSNGQRQACVLNNNLFNGRDDGDVLTFKFKEFGAGKSEKRTFAARLRPGATLPADPLDLVSLTAAPNDLEIINFWATTTFSGDTLTNCPASSSSEIIAFIIEFKNDGEDDVTVQLDLDYNDSLITLYGPGAVLLGDNDFLFQSIPGVFWSAAGWGGNNFSIPLDENYDQQFDKDDFGYFVSEFENWNSQTGTFDLSTQLDDLSPGDLIRHFRDLNGNYKRDKGEPRAPYWQRADHDDVLKWEIPAQYMADYNKKAAVDADHSGLFFFERINPFMGAGQGRLKGHRFWTNLDSSTVFGQEFGHSLALVHKASPNNDGGTHTKNSKIEYVSAGYDFINGQVVVGDDLLSMMNSGPQSPVEDGFFEPFEYFQIFNQAQIWALHQETAVAHNSSDQNLFYISGSISEDGDLIAGRSYLTDDLTPTDPDPQSHYRLRFVGANGSLAEYGIPVELHAYDYDDHAHEVAVSTDAFSIAHPFPAETQAAEIWHHEQLLWRLAVSPNAPTVTVLEPGDGQSFGAEADLTISWNGSDADGDDLSYAVRYSADGGATWQTLIADTPDTSFTISLAMRPGGDDSLIEVEASDGFHTTAALSNGRFSVGKKPPFSAAVSAPVDGQEFVQGQHIILTGAGFDLEDGALAPSQMAWSSNQDGDLGSGSPLSPTLSVGTHEILLTVTDSDDLKTSGSVTIEVLPDFDRDSLPDAYEMQYGVLDWWNAADVYEDSDGDGLFNGAEAQWGTDPQNPDSDDDGVTDGAEVSEGGRPTDRSILPQPAALVPSLLFLDFALDGGDPQMLEQPILLLSTSPQMIDWTVSSSAVWLSVNESSGTTPGELIVTVDPDGLKPGWYQAQLTFSGGAQPLVIPVTLRTTSIFNFLPLISRP